MPLSSIFGLGKSAIRTAKIAVLNNTIEKAKKGRLTKGSFNVAERQVPQKHLDMIPKLEQPHQIEILELAKRFITESDDDSWDKFPRFIIVHASHDLLRQVCYIQLEQ